MASIPDQPKAEEFLTWAQIEELLEQAINVHGVDTRCNTADFRLANALVITMKLKHKEPK